MLDRPRHRCKAAPSRAGCASPVGFRLGRVPCSARADELVARAARGYPSRPLEGGSRGSRSFGLHAAPRRSSSWPSFIGRGRGGGRGPRPAWACALLMSSRVVASFNRRKRPPQSGHTVTSTANTRASSHAHGCRDGRSLVDAGSLAADGSLALAASKPSPSCTGSLAALVARPGTTSARAPCGRGPRGRGPAGRRAAAAARGRRGRPACHRCRRTRGKRRGASLRAWA